jgi:hypothetical protein
MGVGLCTVASLLLALFVSSARAQTQEFYPYYPLFQFAIFYNLNMDVSPGQPMNIGGNVFCNGTIWMWPYAAMVFSNNVEAAGVVTNQIEPYDQQSSGGYMAPTYIEAGQPQSGVEPLNMPTGAASNTNGVEGLINLPPGTNGAPNPAAYLPAGQVYLFNEVDLIISNAATGLSGTRGANITIWYQDPNNATPWIQISNDFYALKTGGNTNVVNQISGIDSPTNVAWSSFTFATNVSFYDYREADTVQAVQINVTNLNNWLNNTSGTGGNQYNQQSFSDNGHGINSVFIYNNVPLTGSQLPAVRLVNGYQLPSTTDPGGSGLTTSGLTVVTPQPLYVKGNYNVQTATSSPGASAGTANTTYTYPAALMADAITVLSGNWSDSYTPATSLSTRVPISTTVNAATLEGIVQSTNVNGQNYYSGGIENVLRLEENWSSSTILTYNGSITAMFPSIYATNFWNVPGYYYNPPTRHWGYDVNFNNLGKLPALTPFVSSYTNPPVTTNPPVITCQPTNQAVQEGNVVTFSVSASGSSPLSYQWSENGTPKFGFTTNSFTLTIVSNAQFAGSIVLGTFQVVVTNLYGKVTSSNAVLSTYETTEPVLDTPAFSSGNQIQFDVAGVAGFNYAVQASTNLIDWVPLLTNTPPFTFMDTNAAGFQQRFYRSVYLP